MGSSENSGTPKSSILIGFSIFNHPFWGTTIFGNIHMDVMICHVCPACVELELWEWEDRSPFSAKDSSCTSANVRRLQSYA